MVTLNETNNEIIDTLINDEGMYRAKWRFVNSQARRRYNIDRDELEEFVRGLLGDTTPYGHYSLNDADWEELAEWMEEEWCEENGLDDDQFGE